MSPTAQRSLGELPQSARSVTVDRLSSSVQTKGPPAAVPWSDNENCQGTSLELSPRSQRSLGDEPHWPRMLALPSLAIQPTPPSASVVLVSAFIVTMFPW